MPDPNFQGDWVHCIETTYGNWLYGDPRGFRTRHHREHIEGDYKSRPPAGMYDAELTRSRNALSQSPVKLSHDWKQSIGLAIRDRLVMLDTFVLCLSVSATHMHVLSKIPTRTDARKLMGLAKKHATFEAKSQGWAGKLWAKRGKIVRIRDRSHQLNAYAYILAHEKEGAWIWKWQRH